MLKIAGGEYRGRKLKAVPGEGTRPTSAMVREALFNIVGPRRPDRVLDAFSGTGAIALEALSRGAGQAVAIEQSARAAAVIAENAAALGAGDRIAIVRDEVLRALARRVPEPGFDLLFADPPYAFERWEELLAALARVAGPGAIVAIEHAADRPLPEAPALEPVRAYRYGGTALSLFSRRSGPGGDPTPA